MWDFSSSFLGAFSIVFCTAGILALLLLPVLAKNTYIFENALMPGYGNPMLSSQDVSEANKWVKDIIALNSKSQGAGMSARVILHLGMLNFLMEPTATELALTLMFMKVTNWSPL
ncbi:uncharacterized protein LOC132799369 [Ziziphus jujuba]|uniref:Uncharacterized protein LOC132799369 n=1 Tax=Ziziphus jujuba TaxID=326968 RepID=A0ABM3ZZA4_ZIZJJ|nr:uncharacterized protein LOC132799369 [Ziziphus jujuba]